MEGNKQAGAGVKPAPWHFGSVWRPLALFTIWWVLVQAFALIAFYRLRLTAPDEAYTWTSQIRDVLPVAWQGFAALHAHFDSGFYESIALGGYEADTAAFLPIYPLAIRLVWQSFCGWLPCAPVDAAFAVSNVSALAAALTIHRLARLDGSGEYALRGMWYFFLFPTAFFLTANYTESLFILLAALSLLSARRRHWARAAAFAALALLTRSVGFALWAALLVEWWSQRRDERRAWLWLVPVPLVFAAFEAYLNMQGLSFFTTQYRLFQRAPWNISSLPENLDWAHLATHAAAQVNFALDVTLALLSAGTALVTFRRWRASYGVFGLLCILIPIASGHTLGLARFALAAFTVPLALARLGQIPWFDRGYTLSAGLLLALYTLLFVHGYWAG